MNKSPRFIILLLLVTAAVFAVSPRYRRYTVSQKKAMKEKQAIISTRLGRIVIEFFPDAAPNHVANFIELTKKGFYNKTTFHRVIPRFMVQGGDPKSKSAPRHLHGTGGPGYYLKAEFNKVPHKRGIVSMARSQHPDSAGSQFFICVADAPSLDGKYTVFGRVVKGMNVVDKIAAQRRDRRNNPLRKVVMNIAIVTQPKK